MTGEDDGFVMSQIPLSTFSERVETLPPAQQVMLMRLLLATNPTNFADSLPLQIEWADLADQCGIHFDTARKHARALMEAGLLHRVRLGGRKFGYYVTLPEERA